MIRLTTELEGREETEREVEREKDKIVSLKIIPDIQSCIKPKETNLIIPKFTQEEIYIYFPTINTNIKTIHGGKGFEGI